MLYTENMPPQAKRTVQKICIMTTNITRTFQTAKCQMDCGQISVSVKNRPEYQTGCFSCILFFRFYKILNLPDIRFNQGRFDQAYTIRYDC